MEHKIALSEKLGQEMKAFRLEYKVKAKDVAEFLGKSPAYISKIEKGQIQRINKKEFIKITNFIAGNENGYEIFCNRIISNTNVDEINRNLFLLNFDYTERKVPINESLINKIKEMFASLDITEEYLAEYINDNEDLGEEFFSEHNINIEEIEKNIWHTYYEADSLEHNRSYIVLYYTADRIKDLLNEKIKKCEYIFIYAIVYHLFKLLHKKQGEKIDEGKCLKCQSEAEQFLLENKFYSLAVRAKAKAQSKTKEEYTRILNDFDINNMHYLRGLLSAIQYLTDSDIDYTNEKLKVIVENLNEGDRSFALAFMALPLKRLKELAPHYKRQLLIDIKELLDEYAFKMTEEECIEKY